MALQMDITLTCGVEVKNAYVKVTSISGYKEKMCCVLNAFKDRESMVHGFPMVDGFGFIGEFTPILGLDVGDFITQAYLYLKTLPEFENAEDILEEYEQESGDE